MADERVKHAEFYEPKGLEARAKAETIKDWDARRRMLLVASMWEALAKNRQRRALDVSGNARTRPALV
jgi:hypothetical protein